MSKWSVFDRGRPHGRAGTFSGRKLTGAREHGDTARPKRVKQGPSGLSLGDALTAWKQDQEFVGQYKGGNFESSPF